MRPRFAASFVLASLVCLSACATEWAAQPLPLGPQTGAVAGSRVRVTRTGGEVMELTSAAVHGDSLFGIRAWYDPDTDPRVALPLAEVARIEAARTNTTIPAAIGVGALLLVFRWIILPGLNAG